MQDDIWENLISLNSHVDGDLEALGPASSHRDLDDGTFGWDESLLPVETALARDQLPLPTTAGREGYHGPNHYRYWKSGIVDYMNVRAAAAAADVEVNRVFEFGAATARVLRNFALQDDGVEAYGADINKRHVDWVNTYLSDAGMVMFQNHSIPQLPFEDNFFDVVTAFSVFTHIEVFDITWLLELRRVLRPGGIAWITFMTDQTWAEMTEDWPAYHGIKNHPDFEMQWAKPTFDEPRRVFRWRADRSYSSNVFVHFDYIRNTLGRVMPIIDEKRRCPAFQDVVVFQKPSG